MLKYLAGFTDVENMQPEQIAKAGTEHAHQAALFCWAQQNVGKFPCLRWIHAIPNGGLRNKVTASRLKAEGVKQGVCDIFLPYPISIYHGLYIEMKKPGGRISEFQEDFIFYVRSVGYRAVVCESWEVARDEILLYLP